MSKAKLPIGTRIRCAREKAGRTQAAVAGLCGITEAYLSQIERGLKVPSVDVLMLIAHELRAPLASLLDDERSASTVEASTAPSVADALMRMPAPDRAPPTTQVLRERVEGAWRIWQTSEARFSAAAAVLPALIHDTESALRALRGTPRHQGQREILRCAADLYGMVRSYCRRTGRVDLSLMVADRARRAAEDADDPIRSAAAQWNLGHVLLADGHPEGASDVAEDAISHVLADGQGAEAVAMAGALDLVAATSAVRAKQWGQARARLDQKAAPRAEEAGEGNVSWTVFGPTNVSLHRLGIEMEAGETTEALRIADQVDIDRLPSLERQFTFKLQVAMCYAQRREDAAVLVHLLDLETLSSEDACHSPEVRELVVQLRDRVRPTYRKQVTALADRLGVA